MTLVFFLHNLISHVFKPRILLDDIIIESGELLRIQSILQLGRSSHCARINSNEYEVLHKGTSYSFSFIKSSLLSIISVDYRYVKYSEISRRTSVVSIHPD